MNQLIVICWSLRWRLRSSPIISWNKYHWQNCNIITTETVNNNHILLISLLPQRLIGFPQALESVYEMENCYLFKLFGKFSIPLANFIGVDSQQGQFLKHTNREIGFQKERVKATFVDTGGF